MVQTTQERKLGLQSLTNRLQEKITADDIKTDHLDHRIIHQMVAELRRDMHETVLGFFYFDGFDNKVDCRKNGFCKHRYGEVKKVPMF